MVKQNKEQGKDTQAAKEPFVPVMGDALHNGHCVECGREEGEPHYPLCDFERCPICHAEGVDQQLITCFEHKADVLAIREHGADIGAIRQDAFTLGYNAREERMEQESGKQNEAIAELVIHELSDIGSALSDISETLKEILGNM